MVWQGEDRRERAFTFKGREGDAKKILNAENAEKGRGELREKL